MTRASRIEPPFPVPQILDPVLARVRGYWLDLRRGQADIPFTDDVRLGALSDSGAHLFLVDVFERPARFRIAVADPGIGAGYGQPVEGLFADEIVPRAPLDFFLSQCSATVEGRSPSYYRSPGSLGYSRTMLPLWGDGHINGLLCAVV